jgi:hypothetical protein
MSCWVLRNTGNTRESDPVMRLGANRPWQSIVIVGEDFVLCVAAKVSGAAPSLDGPDTP